VEGSATRVVGKLNKGAGKLTRDEKLQKRGEVAQVKGAGGIKHTLESWP
jgi:uncharacterized protein YjbJ (UPF0337 family)